MTRRMHPLRSVLAALTLLLASISWAGALEVTGNVGGRWTTSMSPVLATGACFVRSGASLVIEPGVQVCLGPGASLIVEGSLTAIGSPANPIRIERVYPTAGAWRSLSVRATGQAMLASCLVSGGGFSLPGEVTGAIRVDGGHLDLLGCEVSGSASSGVLITGGAFVAASSWFDRNGGSQPIDAGIHVIAGSVSLASGAHGNRITNSVFGLYNDNILPVTAPGVWWGSATGPQHATNIDGLGVSVSDDVIFTDYVTVNPFRMRGDLDRDGHVTVNDVAHLLKIAGGLSAADAFVLEVGDVEPNGAIDLRDAQSLALVASGLALLP